MNDWLNYEGSGSSLSHSFGYGYGYGYDYGTTRHGSVLVHDDRAPGTYVRAQGPVRQGDKIPYAAKRTLTTELIDKQDWYNRGIEDVDAAISLVGNMFRRNNYRGVIDYLSQFRNTVRALQQGHSHKGVMKNKNVYIPPNRVQSYLEGIRSKEDLISMTEYRAREELNSQMKNDLKMRDNSVV